MKKVLIGAGAFLAGISLLWAVFVATSKNYEHEVRSYAAASIVAIASNWDEQALIERASPELFARTNKDEIHEIFSRYRKLGRMLNLGKDYGRFDVVYTTAGQKIVAVYVAEARFEHANVVIKLSLTKHDAEWQIVGFDVMPPWPPERGSPGAHVPAPLPKHDDAQTFQENSLRQHQVIIDRRETEKVEYCPTYSTVVC